MDGRLLIYHPFWLPLVLVVLGFVTLAIATFKPLQRDAMTWVQNTGLSLLCGWLKPFQDIGILIRVSRHRSLRMAFHFSWLIPVALGLIFIGLFSQANPIIHLWLSKVDWQMLTDILSVPRLLFLGISAWVIWSVIRPYPFKLLTYEPAALQSPVHTLLSPAVVRNSLLIFNLIFLVQSGLDYTYLWQGVTVPAGMTYAEYAHSGAYPLILTALLAGGFVLFALRPDSVTARTPGVVPLVTLWILQNVFLTISSILRTLLYVQVYSLTHLRVAAFIWMGLVALGLFWVLLRIIWRRNNRWLINANVLSLLVVLYGCSFFDFDGMIAWYNVSHSQEVSGQGLSLDVSYFENSLGTSAIPALDWFERHISNESCCNTPAVRDAHARLSARLSANLADWHTWTWREQRLADGIRSQAAGYGHE